MQTPRDQRRQSGGSKRVLAARGARPAAQPADLRRPSLCPPSLLTEEAIAAVKRDGITQLVVLPLYPQFSVSTSGSSLRLLERLLKEDPVLARVG